MATRSPKKKEFDDFLKEKHFTKNLNQCHLSPIQNPLIISHTIHHNTPIAMH